LLKGQNGAKDSDKGQGTACKTMSMKRLRIVYRGPVRPETNRRQIVDII
jgi:hypothetical protein